MSWLILALTALAFASSAAGEMIYTWTDAKGAVHYTNSEYEIPTKYRARAKTLNLDVVKASDTLSQPKAGASSLSDSTVAVPASLGGFSAPRPSEPTLERSGKSPRRPGPDNR